MVLVNQYQQKEPVVYAASQLREVVAYLCVALGMIPVYSYSKEWRVTKYMGESCGILFSLYFCFSLCILRIGHECDHRISCIHYEQNFGWCLSLWQIYVSRNHEWEGKRKSHLFEMIFSEALQLSSHWGLVISQGVINLVKHKIRESLPA